MDGKSFDRLTRQLADGRTRRSVLGGIAAAAAGLVAAGKAEARFVCRTDGVVCSKNADCCDQSCGPKNQQGRRVCGGCLVDKDCHAQVGVCQENFCSQRTGQCDVRNLADNTICGFEFVCFSGVCASIV